MATIKKLEDLEAWQEARKLCNGIYEIVKIYPQEEKYNLVRHLKESERGTMGNIAEGFGRYFYVILPDGKSHNYKCGACEF